MKKYLIICALALTTVSCSFDNNTQYYASQKYAARPVETVKILHAAPTKPYEVLADFQSKGGSEDAMREKAADIGADAVIVTRPEVLVPLGNERPDEGGYHSLLGNAIFATAIRFK